MNFERFFTIFLDFCNVIPAAFLCFIPMKNQMRFGTKKTVKIVLPVLLVSLIIISVCAYSFDIDSNTVLFAFLVLFFILYHMILTVHISKSLAIFSYMCVVMALISNYTIMLDATIHPDSGANNFSLEGSVFQMVLAIIVVALIFVPIRKFGCVLVDNLDMPNVWFTVVILAVLFLAVNVIIRPLKYQTLYTNNVFIAFFIVISMMLITMILLTIIFYFIVSGLIRQMKTAERNRMLEMQESQYIKQQEYMKKSAAARHDFRQTILTLESLVAADNYDAIKDFITDYTETMPQNDVISFCPNHAVNALLNYYHDSAESEKIRLDWQVELPEHISVSNTDLCNILGNLIENAIISCRDMPEEKRYIDLSVTVSDDETYLCIVMTNPFMNARKKLGGRYMSTHRNGSGIGLSSVASIADKYGGVARFTDEDSEFCSDVMLMLH